MNGLFGVPASRLRGRTFEFNDLNIEEATLFPFFDQAGTVERSLVVDSNSSNLRTFLLESTRVRVPYWGPIRVDCSSCELAEDVIDHLARLWHYDPWWLLEDERFESHGNVSSLKLTNCADSFERQPSDILFNSRLTAINKVKFTVPAESYETKPFLPEMLPIRATYQSQPKKVLTRGWHLDPMW